MDDSQPGVSDRGLEPWQVAPAWPRDAVFSVLLRPVSAASPAPSSENWMVSETREAVYDPFLPWPFEGKTWLAGRDALLQQLVQRLFATGRVALHGLPGVGKTALAIALTQNSAIRERFRDGILWAGMGIQGHLLAELWRWGTLLGLAPLDMALPSAQSAWLKTLRETLEERQILLVIDDVWREEVVKAFETHSPVCACILTTRFKHLATHFAQDNVCLVPELENTAAVQVLTRFAPELLEQDSPLVLELVNAVGGLPLALTLMSRYLGSQAFTRQPRRLRTALEHLQDTGQRLRLQMPPGSFGGTSSIPERSTVSIESVITLSYLHLPPAAQKALRSLAILPAKPGRLSREAVLAVTGASSDILQVVCDAGLLELTYPNHSYLVHPLIIDYARHSGAEPEASARLIMYGVAFVEAHAQDTDALEQESAVILAALRCAWEEKHYAELLQVVWLFVPWLLRWGWYTVAEQLLRQATTALQYQGETQDEIILRELLSTLAHAQGNYLQSRQYAQEGLALAQRMENREKAIALLIRLGVIAQEQGNYTQAEAFYQEGLLLAHTQGTSEHIIILLRNLGVIAKKRGACTQAQRYYLEALTRASLLGYKDLRGLLLMNLGVIASESGAYSQALDFYQKGLALSRETGNREQVCVLLSNLGVVAEALGDYAQAEQYLREGLALARRMGHRERISLLLLNLGVIVERQGNDLYAEEIYQEGLALARKIGHYERISLLLLNLGDLALERGRYADALASYREGLALAQKIGLSVSTCDLQIQLGVLATRQGEREEAEEYLQVGLELAYQLGHPQLMCKGLAAWGELHLHYQRLRAAGQVFLHMLEFIPSGHRVLEADAQYGLARIAAGQGQLRQARELAEQSYATFDALHHYRSNVVRSFLTDLGNPLYKEERER